MISTGSLLQSPCKTLIFSIGNGNGNGNGHGFLACTPFSTRLRTSSGFSQTSSSRRLRSHGVVCGLLPVDPWAPSIDSQSIASQLFAFSLFPYLGFLYFITKSKTTPGLTLFGFYFLLAFVGATSNSISSFFFLFFLKKSILCIVCLFACHSGLFCFWMWGVSG